MTEVARIVLEDCKSTLKEIRKAKYGPEWRRRWVSLLALLRAVGHVLRHVDRERGPELRNAIDAWWKEIQIKSERTAIFWDFIHRERNNLLKEYEFSAVHVAHIGVITNDGDLVVTNAGEPVTVAVTTTASSSHSVAEADVVYETAQMMKSGPYQGENATDVAQRAIDWWEQELGRIENCLG